MAVSCPAVGSAGARGNRGLTVRGGPDGRPGQPARVRSRRNTGAGPGVPSDRAVEQGGHRGADRAGAHGLPVAGEVQPDDVGPAGAGDAEVDRARPVAVGGIGPGDAGEPDAPGGGAPVPDALGEGRGGLRAHRAVRVEHRLRHADERGLEVGGVDDRAAAERRAGPRHGGEGGAEQPGGERLGGRDGLAPLEQRAGTPGRITQKRSTVTPTSRTTTTTVTHHGSTPSTDRPISAVPVSALSAIGSASLPNSVTCPVRRAMSPSYRSVMIASAKQSAAHQRAVLSRTCPTPSAPNSSTANTGTAASRRTVSPFGRLTSRAEVGGVAAGSVGTALTAPVTDRSGRSRRCRRSAPG